MNNQNQQLSTELKNKGNELFRSGSYAEAISYYKQAIDVDQSNPILHSNLAQALLNTHDYHEAYLHSNIARSLDKTEIKHISRLFQAL